MSTTLTHVSYTRDVGIKCPLHKQPLVAGRESGTGDLLYACPECQKWYTAAGMVQIVAILEKREADRIRDARLLKRKVAPCTAPRL